MFSPFPPLPRLRSVLTFPSRAGGTWSQARARLNALRPRYLIDSRSRDDMGVGPSKETLENLALMNRMIYANIPGLGMPEDVAKILRRGMTMRNPKLDVSDVLFDRYRQRALACLVDGTPARRIVYGDYEAVAILGSQEQWWTVERLYLDRLFKEFWPTLALVHVA